MLIALLDHALVALSCKYSKYGICTHIITTLSSIKSSLQCIDSYNKSNFPLLILLRLMTIRWQQSQQQCHVCH